MEEYSRVKSGPNGISAHQLWCNTTTQQCQSYNDPNNRGIYGILNNIPLPQC